ncbi:MAG: DUF2179 domain-containing protein [Candidatus Kapaibacteriota bacterium]
METLQLDFYHLIVIPIFIIFGRILDVSIGTTKIILISKGYRSISTILGFFESFIWILVVSQIMKKLDNYYYFAAYALGFALGTYIGMSIERYLSLGQVIIRVITRYPSEELSQYLFDNNYSVTKVPGEGKYGPVNIIFLVVHRNQIDDVINIIHEFNPKAFYTIEDVRSVSHLHLEKSKPKIYNSFNFFKSNQRK